MSCTICQKKLFPDVNRVLRAWVHFKRPQFVQGHTMNVSGTRYGPMTRAKNRVAPHKSVDKPYASIGHYSSSGGAKHKVAWPTVQPEKY